MKQLSLVSENPTVTVITVLEDRINAEIANAKSNNKRTCSLGIDDLLSNELANKLIDDGYMYSVSGVTNPTLKIWW